MHLYLNILEYGVGGNKSLVDGKNKTSEKPEWWDDANNFDKFTHPSKAKLNVNEDIIASILKYHGYDPEIHCLTPPLVDIGEVNVDINNNRGDVDSRNREDVEIESRNRADSESGDE